MKKITKLLGLSCAIPLLFGCGRTDDVTDGFGYEDPNYEETIDTSVKNNETYDYDDIKLHELSGSLREDFAYGVDASMVLEIEKHGGIYYNKDGYKQDVFEIMKDAGVNFIRLRNWVNPYTSDKAHDYGGGNNDTANNIELAKRAKRVGMNVLIDFHYSDFWADPDTQNLPKAWKDYSPSQVYEAVHDYTYSTLETMKNEGISVDAVQIGNEINTGMLLPIGKINFNRFESSMETVSTILKEGISGAKEIFPNVKTIIHLAEGGDKDYFDDFFSALETNEVPYDIIGASYYSYWHGSKESLKANLDNCATKFNKPVMIVETSYGFTNDTTDLAGNIYNETFEDKGGYKTSIQAQASLLNDLVDVLSQVPNNLGLGIFYWEPCFIPVKGAGWATRYGMAYNDYAKDSLYDEYDADGLSSWANQSLFSYEGRALPSLYTYKYIQDKSHIATEEVKGVSNTSITVTLNLAKNEKLPTTYPVLTSFDAFRDVEVIWNEEDVAQLVKAGSFEVKGKVGTFDVIAYVTCLYNYINDGGFEDSPTSAVSSSWTIEESNQGTVKLEKKNNVRSGSANMNWYAGTADYNFKMYQSLGEVVPGKYILTTYVMAPVDDTKATKIQMYVKGENIDLVDDITDDVLGWGSPVINNYVPATIEVSLEEATTLEIGLIVEGPKTGWGHNDDWSFVSVE